jgi:hypothetical protein
MASFSIQVSPGFEDSLNPADVTAGTAAPTTATDLEVRIDLVNATGGAGWTVTKVRRAFDVILAYLLEVDLNTSLPQSLET